MSLDQFLEIKESVSMMMEPEEAEEDTDWKYYDKDMVDIYKLLKDIFKNREEKSIQYSKFTNSENIKNHIYNVTNSNYDFMRDLVRIDYNKSISYLDQITKPTFNTLQFNLALVNCRIFFRNI